VGFLTSHRAQAEAKRFAESVKPGRTYYSIEEVHLGYPGPSQLLKEWKFTGPSRRTGQPMCEHMTAAYAWLSYGPIYADRPRGLKTFKEWQDYEVAGPDAAKAVQERDRARAGRR
jgi:hypothetical protein